MKNLLPSIRKLSVVFLATLLLIIVNAFGQQQNISQQKYDDDPKYDRKPIWSSDQSQNQNPEKAPSVVVTVGDYDNFYLGTDFAEAHLSVDPADDNNFFTAYNALSGDAIYRTQDGHDWNNATSVAWGVTVQGDVLTAYDASGNLYYENMYGSTSILGCKIVRSSNNGLSWSTPVTAISGVDKNWLAVDPSTPGANSPYAGYVYTVMTASSGGNFARSTNLGATWTTTFSPATQSRPGMMVCVGAYGATNGGAVYVVTNSGLDYASTFTFYRSLNGGSTFTNMSTQSFTGYVGTWLNSRHSVENMRTRPYPYIAADNSSGTYRGRLYLVYATNNPAGSGNKPNIYCRYSTNGGTTWSAEVRVNDDASATANNQWSPAIWCDPENGRLYIHWMDTRDDLLLDDQAYIYATYSDNGGASFVTNQRISNEIMTINCTTCPGGGTPRYQGDYTSIVSHGGVSMSAWTDFRDGSYDNYVAYFPDYAMKLSAPYKGTDALTTVNAEIPSTKLYTGTVTFVATMQTPASGSFSISYPDGNTLSTFPGSRPIAIISNSVPAGNYTLTVVATGSGGTPVHRRTTTISVTGPNVWTGAFNYWWHNAQNWSLGHIPTAGEDVIITSAGYHPPKCAASYNEECYSLTIQAGAALNIEDDHLVVNGPINVNGELAMINASAKITCYGDFSWNSGSTANITNSNAFIYVYGNWNFNAGANANLTTGFVDFNGSSNSWIRAYSSNCSFYNLRVYKTGGASARVSNLCTNDLVVNNLTFVSTGAILHSLSNYGVVMKGPFNYYGSFDFTQNANTGSVVFDGTTQAITKYSTSTGIFNNVVFSSSVGTSLNSDALTVMGDLTIESGYFNSNGNPVEIHGSWNNTGGTYTPGLSVVTFNGSDHQDVYGTNTFYKVVQLNTGYFLRFNDPTTITNNLELYYRCWSYDLMTIGGTLVVNDPLSRFGVYSGGNVNVAVLDQGGEIAVSASTLIVGDLVESGIEGTHHLLSGELTLNQPSGFTDLNGTVIINDGVMNVNGSGYSYWPYTHDASITMSGGVLDMNSSGILLYDTPTYSLTENITGGTIRTASGFSGNRSDFTPTAGLFEFYGTSDASLLQSNGCTLFNINIDKAADKSSSQSFPIIPDERSEKNLTDGGNPIVSSKANNATLSSDFVVSNDLSISGGILNTNIFNLYVGGNWSNTAGPDAFVENSNTVFFNGPNDGDILTEETFYNLTESKSNANFTALESFNVVHVTNDLHIVDGVYEMNYPGDLIVNNNVTIQSGAGLNANDGAFNIYVGGNWTNYNTDYDIYHGFWHGYISTVIFNSGGNNILTTNAPQEDFWNLTIYKPSDEFRSNDNIQVFGDLLLFDGEWNDNVSGLTHTFHGDFEVTNNAAWYTHVSPNTVVFTGTGDQEFTYDHIGVGYFRNVIVNKVLVDIVISSDLDPSGKPAMGENDGTKAQMLTMLTDMDIQLGGTLTINEGTVNVNGHTLRGDGNVTINTGGILTLNSNSTLWLDNGAELSVNGGILETLGTPGNMATITHRNTGYYAFEIENGGTISAEYTNFEYTNGNGVWIKETAFVDPVHAFHYCTFLNGTAGFAPLLVINNNQILTCNGVNFPQTGVSDYNAAKAIDAGEMNMVGATGDFQGEDYEYDPYNRVHWTYPNRSLNLTMFLEGPFNDATNSMNLGINSILPLNQPFDTPPLSNPSPDWYYTGLESVGAIPNPSIVDWVLVQLRDAPTAASALPATSIFTQAAFITSTGQIVDLDGVSPLNFTATVSNNLYAVVWSRNHLGIISANPLLDIGGMFTYDFSSGSGQAYGGMNSQKQISTVPVIWGTIPGDANATGLAAIGDKTNVWSLQAGESGYLESDYNFDGEADHVDKNDFWLPNMGKGSQIPE
jgi:hypothetical protein